MNSKNKANYPYLCSNLQNLSLTCISLNVRGLQNEPKRRAQFIWAKKEEVDVIFFQETHSSASVESIWKNQWGSDAFFSHGSSNARGTAILFKQKGRFQIEQQILDPQGRYVWLKIKTQDFQAELLNVYAPTNRDEQLVFYDDLNHLISANHCTRTPLLIGGDFNCILDPKLDKKGGIPIDKSRDKVSGKIIDLLEEFSLIDAWRQVNPNKKAFTWSKENPSKIETRLDMWFIPHDWTALIKYCRIVTSIYSDHKAVKISLQGTGYKSRGKGVWKLNSSILGDVDYVEKIQNLIDQEKQDWKKTDPNHTIQDHFMFWYYLKSMIRFETQRYCTQRAQTLKKRETEVVEQMKHLESNLHTLSEADIEEYKNCKLAYEKMYEKKAQGALIRSRAKWLTEGEKNTKYFFSLEKYNYNQTCIRRLINSDDQTVTNPKDIHEMIWQYYSSLYTEKPKQKAMDSLLEHSWIPKINLSDTQYLETEVTLEEITEALRELPEGKAPGPDGFSVEFYKKFWPDLGPLLLAAYYELYNTDSAFLIGFNDGMIRLIPKPGKNNEQLENWRPITLLNVDYKILSKVMASRIKVVISDIVHPDQAGFIKGRYIGKSIRTILDIIDKCDHENISGILASLDIHKAFDSINWEYAWEMMIQFGFPEQFIKWLKLLYRTPRSCVINNGFLTKNFNLEKGVRQGCPVSPYIFILAFEGLSLAIRHNNDIQGIFIDGSEFKLVQYADDTNVFLKDENALKNLTSIMELFQLFSGLQVNHKKTTIIGLGPWKNQNKTLDLYTMTSNPVKILGIWVSHNKKEMHDRNIGGKIERMKNILNSWHSRGLSLQGRILVLKALGLSQLTYVLTNLVVPNHYLKQIDQICFNFIWNNKKAKVKKDVLIQDYDQGGLKAPDIYTWYYTWKHTWLVRLINMENNPWKTMVTKNLNKIGGLEYLLDCNFDLKQLAVPLKSINEFVVAMLEAYQKIFRIDINETTNQNTIMKQTINNNRYIKIGEKSAYFSNLTRINCDKMEDWLSVNDNGDLNFNEFHKMKNRYGKSLTWFQYCQITAAIPKPWKDAFKFNESKSFVFLELPPPGSETPAKIKERLLAKKSVIPTGIKKWKLLFSTQELSPKFWNNAFIAARRTTKESKLQMLQYKILHRIIPCNRYLFQINVKPSPYCNLCQELDTVEHMFFECKTINELWINLSDWFHATEKTEIQVNLENCLINQRTTDRLKWNFLAIELKQHIYICKMKELKPTFNCYMAKLKQKLLLIKTTLNNQTQLEYFEKRWKTLVASD